LNQAKLAEGLAGEQGAIEIVDEAHNAEGPIRKGPDNFQLMIAAAVLGIAIGIGFVVISDLMDDSVKTALDAKDLLNLPVTGVIPSLPGAAMESGNVPARVSEHSPSSPYAEAYRFLAMDLLLLDKDSRPQVLMMVTPKPGQGGTTTAANLAICLAQGGQTVVLVDADMRRPSLHLLFDLESAPGLSSLLQNGFVSKESLQETRTANLQLLAAGPRVDNPWSLLRSEKMSKLISSLREMADFVVIDTPSAMVFPDALAISEFVDGAIFVVRSHESLKGEEVQLKEVLNKARVPIVGVVLNDVPPENVSSYQYCNRYYSSNLLDKAPSEDKPALESKNDREPGLL
jgi:receptor protein-tyrosine kinase